MYEFKNAYRQEDPFVTKVSEIRELADAAEKAIAIIRSHHEYCPFVVPCVYVEGGCHERDTGYMEFDGGTYPYRDGDTAWYDALIHDFEEEKAKLDGGWFSTLNFSNVVITVLAQSVPIVLKLENGALRITMSYPAYWGNNEKEILHDLEKEFGPCRVI